MTIHNIFDRGDMPRMRLAITGSSGLIGRALKANFIAAGHEVVSVVRRAPHPEAREIAWKPSEGEIDARGFEGLDAVIHLAGADIASGRWTAQRKELIRTSRTQSTQLLAQTLARLERKPKVLISASGVNYYGFRGDEICTEETDAGTDFLATVCREWEHAATPAREAGIRVVHPRMGVVLTRSGGALPKMLPPFKMGMGGKLGSGKQYFNWIAIDDLVELYTFLLRRDDVAGPVNACSPNPVTNAEFTKTLGRVLNRPAIFTVPGPALKLALGEMAEVLLKGQRVVPKKAQAAGFQFAYPDLEGALRSILARHKDTPWVKETPVGDTGVGTGVAPKSVERETATSASASESRG